MLPRQRDHPASVPWHNDIEPKGLDQQQRNPKRSPVHAMFKHTAGGFETSTQF
jgi:hypothetical protein